LTHLSAERTRLQSENAKLKQANTIQQIALANLQQTINNYKEQNASLNTALAQALIWAASNKNSADSWEGRFAKAFGRLAKLSPREALSISGRDAGDDANTLNPTNGADAPLFDPRDRHITHTSCNGKSRKRKPPTPLIIGHLVEGILWQDIHAHRNHTRKT